MLEEVVQKAAFLIDFCTTRFVAMRLFNGYALIKRVLQKDELW